MKSGAGDDPFADDLDVQDDVDEDDRDQDVTEDDVDEDDRDQDVTEDDVDEDNEVSSETFVDEIVSALDELESGEKSKTVGVRDQPIAALLLALDESDEMVDVGNDLEDALDREHTDEFDRSTITRLAIRVGLQEAAPDVMDQLAKGIGKHAQQNV